MDHYYNHAGVAVTAASGDYGYGTIWPAASHHVTAVGGTSLLPASNTRGWDEIAWSGGGSGCSPYETRPSWQHDTGCTQRTVADVAAVADPDAGGVAVYDSYFYGVGWWLSAAQASPHRSSRAFKRWPALQARTHTRRSYPYANRTGLFDILSGTNSFSGCSPTFLCTARSGYDGPTGLGTPDGIASFK